MTIRRSKHVPIRRLKNYLRVQRKVTIEKRSISGVNKKWTNVKYKKKVEKKKKK